MEIVFFFLLTNAFTHKQQLVPAKRGEAPIFSLERVDFDGTSVGHGRNCRATSASWSILAVAVGNGTLAMATSDCCVIRWNADRGGDAEGENAKLGGGGLGQLV